MELSFEIVKKMTRPPKGSRGIALRSIRGNAEAATAVFLSEAYSETKKQVEAYRMMTGQSLSFRARGSSLEISSAGDNAIVTLLSFIQAVSFNSDDAKDFTEFCGKVLLAEGSVLNPILINLTPDELCLTITAEISGPDDAAILYDGLAQAIEPYDMGIVKETPGAVDAEPPENL